MKTGKETTIYDIASRLNISVATVSRALNDNTVVSKRTRKRVFDLAKELGYRHNRFASNLRRQNTHTIGMVVHELNSNFITSVLAGVEKVTTEAGYDLIIAHSNESLEKETANVTNLFHKRVDGLIASLSFETSNLDHFKIFSEKNIPVVFFDRVEENTDSVKVIIDNFRCGYQATQHLIEQGCQRIAIMTSTLQRNVYEQRYKGYAAALTDHHLEVDDTLVFIKDLSEVSAKECALEILAMDKRPDGIFITNDFVAATFMHEMRDHGIRVPEDIAVVGFNNDAISRIVSPTLTTIDYPGLDIGENAARVLINHLRGLSDIKQTSTIIVRSDLIIRESSQKRL
jgi:LacI family transcriptional regulator